MQFTEKHIFMLSILCSKPETPQVSKKLLDNLEEQVNAKLLTKNLFASTSLHAESCCTQPSCRCEYAHTSGVGHAPFSSKTNSSTMPTAPPLPSHINSHSSQSEKPFV